MQGPGSPQPDSQEPESTPAIEALRLELGKLLTKQAETSDPVILSVLNMRISQIVSEYPHLGIEADKAAKNVSAVVDAPEDQYVEVREPSLQEAEEAEKLIRQSRLEKQRGNAAGATKLLNKAFEIAPGSATVMEAVADDLMAHRQLKQAIAILKKATELDPKNVGLGKKHAEAVFAHAVVQTSANMSIDSQLQAGLSDSMFISANDNVAGIWAARFLSFFIPGLGQMVIGRTVKGAIMLVTWALCFAMIIIWQDQVKATLLIFSKNGHGNANPLVLIPVGGIIVAWLAALSDLSGGNSRIRARQSRTAHPAPPVDLPFE